MIGLGLAASEKRKTAVVAAILLAASPLHVYFSREGRPYAAVMLMAGLLLLLLLERRRFWAIPAAYATAIATAYLGAVAAPVLLSFGFLSLSDWIWRSRQAAATGDEDSAGPRWPGHYPLAAAVGLGIGILIFPFVQQLKVAEAPTEMIVTQPLSTVAMDRLLASLTISGVEWGSADFRSFLYLGLALWGAVSLARTHGRRAFHVTGMFVLPVGCWLALLIVLERWYNIRYTSAGLPAFLLLAAIGIVDAVEGLWQRAVSDGVRSRLSWAPLMLAIALTGLLVAPGWNALRTDSWQKPDWRGLARLIGDLAIDDEPVITHGWWSEKCIRYYLRQTGHDVEILSAGRDLSKAKQLVGRRERAWLLFAGFIRADAFRSWMYRLDPVVRGPLTHLELFFFPDFEEFLTQPGRVAALNRILDSTGERGDRREFDTSELLLGSGWSYPESSQGVTFRWAAAPAVEMGLLGPSEGVDQLRLRILPFPSPDRPSQTLEATLNSRPLGHLQLEAGWNEYEIEVPAAYWRPDANLLTLRFGWLQSPAELDPSSPDQRTLAAAFDYVEAGATGTPSAAD